MGYDIHEFRGYNFEFCGREMAKSAISGLNPHIGTGTESGYRYPLYRGELVPVPKVEVPVPLHQ